MPKAFSKEEKKSIRDKLLNIGKESFIKNGFKNTGIRDLTSEINISQGAFYNFFPSKEDLFFKIKEREEEKIKNKLISDEFLNDSINKSSFKKFLYKSFELMDNNLFLKKLIEDEEYQKILDNISDQKIKNHVIEDTKELIPFIKKWQDNNEMVSNDPQAIVGLIKSIFFLSFHKKQIGEKNFKKTLDLFINLISEGLIKENF